MIYIQHRVNKIEQLEQLSDVDGCEIDLRSNVQTLNHIHLSHDPYQLGDNFQSWLRLYKQKNFSGPLILNTKEDGLELTALEILNLEGIDNFFFLDTAMPTLIKYSQIQQNKFFAVRASCYEPFIMAELFRQKVDWVWVDCFYGKCLSINFIRDLAKDFKICMVSPELHSGVISDIENFQPDFANYATAICTKNPSLWKRILS